LISSTDENQFFINFDMEKGRLTTNVRMTINDAQRPPQPLIHFDCGNIADLSGANELDPTKKIEINTSVKLLLLLLLLLFLLLLLRQARPTQSFQKKR
jgi:hypothetical protein